MPQKSDQIKGRWRKLDCCVSCMRPMSYTDKMLSGGICVNCGHYVRGAVCDTRPAVFRMVYKNWFNWLIGRSNLYDCKDDFSFQCITKKIEDDEK